MGVPYLIRQTKVGELQSLTYPGDTQEGRLPPLLLKLFHFSVTMGWTKLERWAYIRTNTFARSCDFWLGHVEHDEVLSQSEEARPDERTIRDLSLLHQRCTHNAFGLLTVLGNSGVIVELARLLCGTQTTLLLSRAAAARDAL